MKQFKTAGTWKTLGLPSFVWCLGILGFGQAFFIVRLFIGMHLGHPPADLNLYLDLLISLAAGALWALIMWFAFIARDASGNDAARGTR